MLLKKSKIVDKIIRFVRLKKNNIMKCYRCDKDVGYSKCPMSMCNKFNYQNFIYVIKTKIDQR